MLWILIECATGLDNEDVACHAIYLLIGYVWAMDSQLFASYIREWTTKAQKPSPIHKISTHNKLFTAT